MTIKRKFVQSNLGTFSLKIPFRILLKSSGQHWLQLPSLQLDKVTINFWVDCRKSWRVYFHPPGPGNNAPLVPLLVSPAGMQIAQNVN